MSQTSRKSIPLLLLLTIPASALLLLAADPWVAKRPAEWTEMEAQQILSQSPWSKTLTASLIRRQSEDERRAGGNMGQETGVGFDGTDAPRRKLPTLQGMFFGIGEVTIRPATQTIGLLLRWETALPVRVAELKTHVIEPPIVSTEGYSLAIYGIPLAKVKKTDPKVLGEPFMHTSFLKREGKEPVKPSSVEVFLREDMSLVVITFPLSAEITKKDGRIQVVAQIGRVAVDQTFDLAAMDFQGNLAL